jgi:hypothetical protein
MSERAMELSPELRRFVLFLVASGFAAAVNILSRIAINTVVSYEVAIILAYLLGMTTAYVPPSSSCSCRPTGRSPPNTRVSRW